MDMLLPLAWAGIISFAIVMYVILDGFTLGTGMLMSILDEEERDLATSVILPTWDGNQTWLVLGGAALYGAFPIAFSALLPVLYLPLMMMVIALLFRGVVFEFRLKEKEDKKYWDRVLIIASLFVTMIQGLLLGNFVEGFEYSVDPYLISDHAPITAFSFFVGLSLVIGYCLLGATRLINKTEGKLQKKMFRLVPYLAIGIMVSIGIVSLWTPYQNEKIFDRWFSHGQYLLLFILPYISVITFVILLFAVKKREEHLPFWCSVVLFLCPYIGFCVSVYPYIIPYKITFWEAAAPTSSLYFMLVGAVIMLPLLIVYTGYAYQIFKGKVKNVFY